MHLPSKLRLCFALVAIFCILFGPGNAQDNHKSWDYPPFGADDIALYKAFQASCDKFTAMKPTKKLHDNPIYGTAGQWQSICQEGLSKKADLLEDYLNSRLTKVKLGGGDGKFTGYYKPVLEGSRKRHGAYQTPLLARPSDLTICNGETGQLRPDGSCRNPYPNRAEIMKNLGNYKVLMWMKDPIDCYFLHIQGSGTVELDDGTTAHLGFNGKNGHPYVAIGKTLRDMGAITGSITAPKIRAWLKANPDQADEVLHSNPSYIFFKETPTEAPGAFGVVLTAGRSMAVDRSFIPMGVPLFIKSQNTFDAQPWQRVMFAQDVGSAIKGANRGDIYFGHGPLAGERAGDQNAGGQLWALVPKENIGMQAAQKSAANDTPELARIEPAAPPAAQ
jgi:membrane-bound lytic murein transglycosylase A